MGEKDRMKDRWWDPEFEPFFNPFTLNQNDFKGPLPQIILSAYEKFIQNSNITIENPTIVENEAPPVVSVFQEKTTRSSFARPNY